MAKAKAIMRAKILALTENRATNDEAEFGRILAFPDHVDEENLNEDILKFSCEGEEVSSKEMQMATDIRAAIRGAVSWRAVVSRPGGVHGKDGEGGKKVQWEDEGEGDEGSEGEEVEMQDQEAEDEAENQDRDDAEDQGEYDEMDEGS